MKKFNRASFKSFFKKNQNNLYIKVQSKFDGMIDMVDFVVDPQFVELVSNEINSSNDIVLRDKNSDINIVFRDRNSFDYYKDRYYEGISVYNCCGKFIVAKAVINELP